MDKLKEIKIKQPDGSYGPSVPVGVDAANVDLKNGKDLETTMTFISQNPDDDGGSGPVELDGGYTKVIRDDIVDGFTSTSKTQVLSANAGRILNDKKADKTAISAPYNFKGSCIYVDLPTMAKVNDTWYVTDKKCKYSWNGNAWYQSSLDESDYESDLAKVKLTAVEPDVPNNPNAVVWIDSDSDEEWAVPEVRDDVVRKEDTWSSEKINQEFNIRDSKIQKNIDLLGKHEMSIKILNGTSLNSPNGTKYKIVVDNDGNLSTQKI